MSGRGTYAASTTTSVARSRDELERTLRRYGVDHFMYASQPGAVMIAFRQRDDDFRIALPMPDPSDRSFRLTDSGRPRSASATGELVEKAVRQRWRALLLKVKADLELAELTAQPLRATMSAHLVLQGGQTVSEYVQAQEGTRPPLPWTLD